MSENFIKISKTILFTVFLVPYAILYTLLNSGHPLADPWCEIPQIYRKIWKKNTRQKYGE